MKKKWLLHLYLMTKYSLIGFTVQLFLLTTTFATNVGAQQIKSVKEVTIQVDFKNTSLRDVFRYVESKTDFQFTVFENESYLKEKISYKSSGLTVEELLLKISKENKLRFQQINNNIGIRKILNSKEQKNPVEIVIQGITITGRVTSGEDQEGLPGVNVIVKGSSMGTVTDIDGNYKLDVPSAESILTFSSVGFVSEEVVVGNQAFINVTMIPDLTALDEIVVVGYTVKKKSDITGSIASISSEQIDKIEAPTLAHALQGVAPGVYVKNNSGQPGGGLSVRIRGVGGLNNSEPLYVLDGMQITGNESENTNVLNSINPNDIESVEILKDASSTAIYGSRAANGVVVITTKRGSKDGTSQLSYSGTYGIQSLLNVGNFDMLNAREFATVVNETTEAAGNAPIFDGSSELFPTPANLGIGTDHFDEIIQAAPIQEHQLSYSGGNEKAQFYSSINYLKQDGVIKTTFFDQVRFRLNLDANITNKIKVGAYINANHGSSNLVTQSSRSGEGGIIGNALVYAPTIPVFNDDGTYAGPEDGFYPPRRTSLSRLENREGEKISSGMSANVYLQAELLKGLSFRTRIIGSFNTSKYPLIVPIFEEGIVADNRSNLTNTISNGASYQWTNVMTYNRSFGDHNILALAGIEARETKSNSLYANSRHTNDEDKIIGPTGTDDDFRETVGQNSFASYFGSLSYNYKSKYYLDGSIRRDGSSNFGPNNVWGVFPSVSAAWRATEEDFFDVAFIDELKLRGSYGEVGSDKVPAFQHIVGTKVQRYAFGGINGQALNGRAIDEVANPNIRWETSKQTNVGIDLGLLGSRLTITAEYFKTNIEDMLLPVSIAATSGTSNNTSVLNLRTVDVNAGALTNSGFEFEAAFRGDIGNSGLSYDIGVNLTTYNNEVTDLATNKEIFGATYQGQNLSRTIVGGSVGDFYGYVVEGIFQTQEEVNDANNAAPDLPDDPNTPEDETTVVYYQAEGTAPGDFKYKDLNGDRIINDEDRTTIGSPVPDFTYGLSLGLNFKGFDFSMLWYGVQGTDIYHANRMDLEASGRTNFNKSKSVLNAWSGEGTSNTIPRRHANDPNFNKRVSSIFVEDGSFLALRNIRLGYSLPSNVCSKIGLSGFNIFAAAQNILVLTEYSGFDPEVGNIQGRNQGAGIDNDFYPKAKTVHFGINVTL